MDDEDQMNTPPADQPLDTGGIDRAVEGWPCPHNVWDNLRMRKGVMMLRCRTCGVSWKVFRPAPCENFFKLQRCEQGDTCPHPHIFKTRHSGVRTSVSPDTGSPIRSPTKVRSPVSNSVTPPSHGVTPIPHNMSPPQMPIGMGTPQQQAMMMMSMQNAMMPSPMSQMYSQMMGQQMAPQGMMGQISPTQPTLQPPIPMMMQGMYGMQMPPQQLSPQQRQMSPPQPYMQMSGHQQQQMPHYPPQPQPPMHATPYGVQPPVIIPPRAATNRKGSRGPTQGTSPQMSTLASRRQTTGANNSNNNNSLTGHQQHYGGEGGGDNNLQQNLHILPPAALTPPDDTNLNASIASVDSGSPKAGSPSARKDPNLSSPKYSHNPYNAEVLSPTTLVMKGNQNVDFLSTPTSRLCESCGISLPAQQRSCTNCGYSVTPMGPSALHLPTSPLINSVMKQALPPPSPPMGIPTQHQQQQQRNNAQPPWAQQHMPPQPQQGGMYRTYH